jgi:hypothetical protein
MRKKRPTQSKDISVRTLERSFTADVIAENIPLIALEIGFMLKNRIGERVEIRIKTVSER